MEIDPATNGNTDAVMAESTLTITPSPPVPASRLSQLTESLKLEHQLLRVPFEHYKKTIRSNHRSLEKEISSVVSSVGDLAGNNWSKDLEEGSNVENLQAQRCRARIHHLDSSGVENFTERNDTKLKRILVDYLLRMSCDLVDIDIFREAKKVVDALKRRESKLEFQLRLQEFVELHVLATLASKSTTECTKYKVLFELQQQWDVLVHQFKQEFCKLYGMTMEPLLNIYLQAGLSALKTPYPSNLSNLIYGFEEGCTKEDPLSQEERPKTSLASTAKKHYSKLVCYISKELMDTENPPQLFLNGYVYITKALEEMADKNKGEVKSPRRGLVCKYTDLVKAYIS
ncbi:hypothetical protein Bca4012_039463 [Brassica carinata]